MTSRHVMAGIGLLILTGCHSMIGEGMPTLTRTGQVQDVVIQETLSPQMLTVNPGDEIRWVNQRQGIASVVFLDPVMDVLSCQRNFGSLMKRTARHQYTANLSTNDSASVCFRNRAEVRYVIRAPSALDPGGEITLPGTIHVEAVDGEADRLLAQQLRRERDLLRTKSEDLELRLQTAHRDRRAAEEATAATQRQLTVQEEETARLASALQAADQEARDVRTEFATAREQLAALESEKEILLSDSTSAHREIRRLRRHAEDLEAEASRVKELEQRLSEQEQQLTVLREEAADRQATAARAALLADDGERARQRVSALTAELAVLGQESAAVKDERERLSGELQQTRDRLHTEEAERAALAQRQQDLTAALEQARQQLEAEKAHEARLEEQQHQVTAALEQRLHGQEAERAELEQAQQQLTVALAQVRQQLEAEKAHQASLEQQQHQVTSALEQRLHDQESERAELEQAQQEVAAALAQARQQLEAEKAHEARLEQERMAQEMELARLRQTPEELANLLKAEIEKGDIKIRQDRDRLTIHVVDRVLFDSGQAKIKPAGVKVLSRVSDVLRHLTDKQIRIEGHTDNVPIGLKLRSKFTSNWELSTARATSVVRYLIDEGGMDRLMLAAGGYADTRPIENNDTDEGKAANRRIEIVLYPKELTQIVRPVPDASGG